MPDFQTPVQNIQIEIFDFLSRPKDNTSSAQLIFFVLWKMEKYPDFHGHVFLHEASYLCAHGENKGKDY